MKIDHTELGDILLSFTLDQFQRVPEETKIDHSFSPSFQNNIRRISRKSGHIVWHIWQAPVKRLILVAVFIMIMLALIACATPAIREAIIDYFIEEKETNYGITFNTDEAANAPDIIEEFYIPIFAPEGYTLFRKEGSPAETELIWGKANNEYIRYHQDVIPKNAAGSTWIGIDAEGTIRTTKNINGYLVEVIKSETDAQYVAVWTDNQLKLRTLF